MTKELEESIIERMQYGRIFLFLGFDYFLESFPFNPVLKVISESLNSNLNSFEELYLHANQFDTENTFNQIKRNVDKIPTNNSLDIISKIRWNAIYTSSIDDLILNRLKTEGRETFPICKSKKSSSYGRDDLNVFYMFGLYSRTDDSEKVPTTKLQFLKRLHEASLMLTTLIESMGPLDTLIISGWNPQSDPFNSEALYQVISRLSEGQLFLFSENQNMNDEFLNELIKENTLSIVKTKLSTFLTKNSNLFENMPNKDSDLESFVRVNSQALEIPTRIKRLINPYGQLVEDKNFNTPIKNKDELFKDFLFESSRFPIWSAYPEKIDFERDYFEKLYNIVKQEVTINKVSQEPILLHGATGTGKSIAIARLCYRLYSDHKYLILHINNHRDSLDFKVIDEICEWAESSLNLMTIICWDGMSNTDTYQHLSSYLASRGRKQIVIGSTYRINTPSKRFVLADDCFNESENVRFKKYLNSHGIDIGNYTDSFDSIFLVTLYRLLPETRFAITSGVVNEASHIKDYLKNNTTVSERCESVIAEAFKNAFIKSEIKTRTTKKIIENINIDNIIDIVMVFGKLGIETPLDIILRVFPKLKASNISDIFKTLDIIRWSENSYGEILLSPRNTLEAEIYCKRILSSYKEHIERLLLVIEHIEQKDDKYSSEIRFCTDIARAFGPNGNSGKDYQDYYLDISNAIGSLIEKKGIKNPKLMLLQANFVREYGKRKFDDRDVFFQEYLDILLSALKVIESAISIEEESISKRRRQDNYSLVSLYGEKTSILGTIANQFENKGNNETQVSKYIIEAIDTIKESFKYDVYNYISLDSIAWIAINYVKKSKELHGERLKVLMEAVSKFDEYNSSDIEERYQSDFLIRKTKLHEALGEKNISNSTLEELKKISLEDYHYYIISKMISGVNVHENLEQSNIPLIEKALDYIKSHSQDLESSYKSNVINLRLYWLLKTKKPLLSTERMVVNENEDFWSEIVKITSRIINCSYNNNVIIYNFLKGVSLFNLSQYKACDDIFRFLSRESESVSGSRRIFKSILMSNGISVRKFSGEIRNINTSRNRGEIYIDELKTSVKFLPSDFSLTESDQGSHLSSFHIAFNFLGPLVDNEKYYKDEK
ncbi:DEAD/DEAH box helicase family protein [Shewanella algae]|uniref:DEAD/DEAH box helicase family protein n=1 Tax=Shewanella algae TaxID=38313 RepID=UPI000B8A7AEB|nr:DEAD/DEAH box helicase family protein [Shewanella algae]OXR99725.1 hypothetical protein AMR44_16285 [Shewanella algae]